MKSLLHLGRGLFLGLSLIPIGAALAVAVAAAPEPVAASPAPVPLEAAIFLDCEDKAQIEAVRLQFPDEAPVGDVVKFMGLLSCTPIALDGVAPETPVRTGGAREVTRKQAFALMDTALARAGLTVVAQRNLRPVATGNDAANPPSFVLLVQPRAR